MKLDEDLGPNREDEFQTDDEENQAERDGECGGEEDDDDVGPGVDDLSRNSSGMQHNSGGPSWPQSYRFVRNLDLSLPKLLGDEHESLRHQWLVQLGMAVGLFSGFRKYQEGWLQLKPTRPSMDMLTGVTPPPMSFLMGSSSAKASGFLSSAYRRSQLPEQDFSLTKPLIISVEPEKRVNTASQQSSLQLSKLSVTEIPPPQEDCSLSQATLNGINVL